MESVSQKSAGMESGFDLATIAAPISAIQGRIIPRNPAKLRILFNQDSAHFFVVLISSSQSLINFPFYVFFSVILEFLIQKLSVVCNVYK